MLHTRVHRFPSIPLQRLDWQQLFVRGSWWWIEPISTPGWLHHRTACVYVGSVCWSLYHNPLFVGVGGRTRGIACFASRGFELAQMQIGVCLCVEDRTKECTQTMQTNASTMFPKNPPWTDISWTPAKGNGKKRKRKCFLALWGSKRYVLLTYVLACVRACAPHTVLVCVSVWASVRSKLAEYRIGRESESKVVGTGSRNALPPRLSAQLNKTCNIYSAKNKTIKHALKHLMLRRMAIDLLFVSFGLLRS